MVACHKRLGDGSLKLSDYFSTPWLSSSLERASLPQAIDLASLYDSLLAPMLPVPARAGERLGQATERLERVRKLERQGASHVINGNEIVLDQ